MDDSSSLPSSVFTSRHINHNRSGKGSSRSKTGGKSGGIFDPRSSLGRYDIGCPALAKLILRSKSELVTTPKSGSFGEGDILDSPVPLSAALSRGLRLDDQEEGAGSGLVRSGSGAGSGKGKVKKGKGNSRRSSKEDRIANGPATSATLEIHGQVEGDGNEGALMCSFDFGGVLSGVAVLAGSRRLLARVIAELEGEDEPEEDQLEAESVASTADYGSDEDEVEPGLNEIEEADERERKRLAAFEKNSFRTPKFWLRWRGWLGADALGAATSAGDYNLQRSKSGRAVEVNTGYLVFSGNACEKFTGTFSCQAFGWKNVKITGTKVASKARDCPLEWTDVDAGADTGKR